MPTLVKLSTDCDFDDDEDDYDEQLENDTSARSPSRLRVQHSSRTTGLSTGQPIRPLSGSTSLHNPRLPAKTGRHGRLLRGAPSANDLCLVGHHRSCHGLSSVLLETVSPLTVDLLLPLHQNLK